MGSELQLTARTTDEPAAESAFEAVFQEVDRLEGLMSTWREGSEIQRLNAAAGLHPVPVGTELRDVLGMARQVSEWTGGKFDVTFAALSGLWKFDYQDQDNTIPDRNDVLRRLPFINYRDLEVDERVGTAFLRRQGMRANLGGVGKGYAVDRASDILRRRGFHDFMIQFGGDMYVAIRFRSRVTICITGSRPARSKRTAPAQLAMWTWARGLSVTLNASAVPLSRRAVAISPDGSGDAGGTTSAVTANRFAARTRSRRLPLFGGREGPSSMDVPTR